MSLKILFFAALSIPVPWEQNDIIIESPQNLELGIYLLFRVLRVMLDVSSCLWSLFYFMPRESHSQDVTLGRVSQRKTSSPDKPLSRKNAPLNLDLKFGKYCKAQEPIWPEGI